MTKFWKNTSKAGRKRLFSDPALLLKEAKKYFNWCDNHPWEKAELVKYLGNSTQTSIPLGRPYTMEGLTYYLGVSKAYFHSAKRNLREKIENAKATDTEIELLETIEIIEQAVRTQQIEGATLGVFNASIIARINGLVEHKDLTSNGQPIFRLNVRDRQTATNVVELDKYLNTDDTAE